MVVVAVATVVVAVAALDARATYGAHTTADEPQYLLSALSLAEDVDLDISDEIDARRFEPFHEIDLDPQTIARDPSGQRLSPHDPLLPLLLALPMGLGGWLAAKVGLALVAAAAAAATLWFAVRRLGVRPVTGSVVVGAFFVTPPLTAYATQVYPEMPAALCVMVGLIALTGPLSLRAQVAAAAAVVALPWLAVKYTPVAAVLAVALLIRMWSMPAGRRRAVVTGAALAVGAAIYLVVHRRVYGGWTVYASGDHFVDGEFGVVGDDPDYLGRSRRLVGLLVDRSFGLVAWNPAMVLAVPALAAAARRRVCGWPVTVGVVAAAWASATWVALTMHGWWWPGRQVVVIVPVLVALIAALVDRVGPLWWSAVVGCVLAAFGWMWLVVEASTGRRTLVVDFFDTSNPWYRAWSALLPDHQRFAATDVVATIAWTLVLAGLAAATWRRCRPRPFDPSVGIEPGAQR